MPSVRFCNVEVIELPQMNNNNNIISSSSNPPSPRSSRMKNWKALSSTSRRTKVDLDEYENSKRVKKSNMMKLLKKKKKTKKTNKTSNNRDGGSSSSATNFLLPRAVRKRILRKQGLATSNDIEEEESIHGRRHSRGTTSQRQSIRGERKKTNSSSSIDAAGNIFVLDHPPPSSPSLSSVSNRTVLYKDESLSASIELPFPHHTSAAAAASQKNKTTTMWLWAPPGANTTSSTTTVSGSGGDSSRTRDFFSALSPVSSKNRRRFSSNTQDSSSLTRRTSSTLDDASLSPPPVRQSSTTNRNGHHHEQKSWSKRTIAAMASPFTFRRRFVPTSDRPTTTSSSSSSSKLKDDEDEKTVDMIISERRRSIACMDNAKMKLPYLPALSDDSIKNSSPELRALAANNSSLLLDDKFQEVIQGGPEHSIGCLNDILFDGSDRTTCSALVRADEATSCDRRHDRRHGRRRRSSRRRFTNVLDTIVKSTPAKALGTFLVPKQPVRLAAKSANVCKTEGGDDSAKMLNGVAMGSPRDSMGANTPFKKSFDDSPSHHNVLAAQPITKLHASAAVVHLQQPVFDDGSSATHNVDIPDTDAEDLLTREQPEHDAHAQEPKHSMANSDEALDLEVLWDSSNDDSILKDNGDSIKLSMSDPSSETSDQSPSEPAAASDVLPPAWKNMSKLVQTEEVYETIGIDSRSKSKSSTTHLDNTPMPGMPQVTWEYDSDDSFDETSISSCDSDISEGDNDDSFARFGRHFPAMTNCMMSPPAMPNRYRGVTYLMTDDEEDDEDTHSRRTSLPTIIGSSAFKDFATHYDAFPRLSSLTRSPEVKRQRRRGSRRASFLTTQTPRDWSEVHQHEGFAISLPSMDDPLITSIRSLPEKRTESLFSPPLLPRRSNDDYTSFLENDFAGTTSIGGELVGNSLPTRCPESRFAPPQMPRRSVDKLTCNIKDLISIRDSKAEGESPKLCSMHDSFESYEIDELLLKDPKRADTDALPAHRSISRRFSSEVPPRLPMRHDSMDSLSVQDLFDGESYDTVHHGEADSVSEAKGQARSGRPPSSMRRTRNADSCGTFSVHDLSEDDRSDHPPKPGRYGDQDDVCNADQYSLHKCIQSSLKSQASKQDSLDRFTKKLLEDILEARNSAKADKEIANRLLSRAIKLDGHSSIGESGDLQKVNKDRKCQRLLDSLHCLEYPPVDDAKKGKQLPAGLKSCEDKVADDGAAASLGMFTRRSTGSTPRAGVINRVSSWTPRTTPSEPESSFSARGEVIPRKALSDSLFRI